MKVLESAPSRYDAGIRLLTLGRLDQAYDRLTAPIRPGQKVLDVGCGTGALTLRAARKGAEVRGIDVNRQMLEIARNKAKAMHLSQNVALCEKGVAELDGEPAETYDVVMSGLCFSELSEDELAYTLREIRRILKPGGHLLVADEVRPKSPLKKWLSRLIRCPLVLVTYLLTQTATRSVAGLPERAERAGFRVASVRFNKMGNFIELVCAKAAEVK